MPFKPKTTTNACANKNNQAMAKFRRLKTIMRKIVETSKMCGKPMTLLVYDEKQNSIVEYFTHDSMKLEHVYQQMDKANKSEKKRTRTNKILTVRSVNAYDKVQDKFKQNKKEECDNGDGGESLLEEDKNASSTLSIIEDIDDGDEFEQEEKNYT